MNMTADNRTGKDRPFGKVQDKLHGRKTLQVTNFLDEFEKDDVKRYVDIVELFQHFGVVLTKKGKSFMAKCPWHNDTTPSLSVDREKGVYNCFGCGESGDIFTLTEKMKGCDFKEALAYLKGLKVTATTEVTEERTRTQRHESQKQTVERDEESVLSTTASGAAHTATEEHVNDAASDAAPESPEAYGVTLSTVADHYHKKLFESEKTLDYLKKRGFSRLELYTRFRIGYVDGTLLSMIGENQKRELHHIGILTDKGYEHFRQCVTFPIVDDRDQVVGIYGRSVDPTAKVHHLYLKGKHRGIFNRKASKVYDEVVLTESIIDALSLIELGIENVQAIYGANGFTDEHLQLLKEDRVKTVVLALDSDEAGREASGKLKEKLMAEGFAVKEIAPPELPGLFAEGENAPVKDWNEYLVQGLAVMPPVELAALVKKAIRDAEERKAPESSTSHLSVEKMPSGYDFTAGEVVYSIHGVKEIFIGNLRARIRAKLAHAPGSEKYYDNLDLYSARSRASFAANLAREFSIEQKRVEKDLVRILEYLEAERDRALLTGAHREDTYCMSAEERELGMEFLTSPRLFDELVHDMDVLGYVGERLNKQLLYLAASSRKLDDPISVLIISQSASGKSMLVDTVRSLMPPEEVIAVTSLSDQALNYVADLEHKFLILSEAIHNEVVEHQLREMLSAKELSRLVTMKDPKTGELRTRLVTTKAIVSTVMSSTRYEVNPENASRSFVIDTDESREQTKRIHARQRSKYTLERFAEKATTIPRVVKKHHAAQRLLTRRIIVNPFGKYLDFPDVLMRTRRDHERFIDLIACVAFIRQYQKDTKERDGVEYIECDLEDYRIAYPIMVEGVLTSTMRELPEGSITLYEEIRKVAREMGSEQGLAATGVGFIQRDIRARTGLGAEFIKKHLRALVEYEYLQITTGRSRGTRFLYRLRADEPMERLDLGMVPTPEAIARLIAAGNDEE